MGSLAHDPNEALALDLVISSVSDQAISENIGACFFLLLVVEFTHPFLGLILLIILFNEALQAAPLLSSL